jgi:Concanavalin A-like lectin/glucanases superfamily
MGFKTTSTRFTQAKSAQSSDFVAFNNASTGNASIAGTSLSSNSVITTYKVTAGSNASSGTTTVSSSGAGVAISSVIYTDQNYNTVTANAAATTFGYLRILGSGFATGANVFLSNTTSGVLSNITANTTLIGSGEIRANVPNTSYGNYTLYVFNPSGSAAIYYSGVAFEPYPIWTSSTISTGLTVNFSLLSYITTVSAVQPIVFTLATGNSLPSGLTLYSNGTVSGTTTISGSSQTFYFYANATDLYNETTTSGNIALTLTGADAQFNLTTALLNAETTTKSFISDASTNNTAMTIVGNAHPTLTTPYLGDGNYSYYFDASASYLYMTADGSMEWSANGNWTAEAWIYLPATPGSELDLLGRSTYNGTTTDWAFYINTSRQLVFYSNGGGFTLTGSGVVPLNAWTHVAVCLVAGSVTLYINGVVASTTSTLSSAATTTASQYTLVSANSRHNACYVSNLRVLNGTALYTTAFTPPTNPLTAIANTKLLTAQSSTLVDKSPYNRAITATSVQISTPTPFATPTSITANIGYSVYFGGTADSFSTPSTTAINTGNFTWEVWVYPTATPSVNAWIYGYRNGGDTSPYLFMTSTRSVIFGGDTTNILTSSSSLTLNTWTHIAVVRSGTAMTMYFNGTSVATATSSQSFSYSGANNIGQSNGGTVYWWQGYLSNFRSVVGTAVYSGAFTPPTSPLTAISGTSLLTLQGNQVIDASSNALAITPNGSPKVINNTYPFTQPTASVSNLNTLGATYFNGSTDYLQATVTGPGTGDFTIEGWAYATTLTSGTPNVFSIVASGSSTGFQIYMSSNYGFGIRSNGANITPNNSGSITPLANTWYHLAMVRKSGTISLYINGILAASTATSYTFSDTQFNIGYSPIGTYFTGFIADVRYVNGTAIYTSNFAPTYQPLTPVANTSLLTLQYNGGANNGGIIDNSSFNNIITRAGTPTVGTFSPYSQTGWSVIFAGTSYISAASNNTAFALGTGDYTIEFWAYSTIDYAVASTVYFFSNGSGGYYFQYVAGTGLQTGLDGSGATGTYAVTLTSETWNHIAISRASGSSRCFVNGTQVGSTVSDANSYGQSGAYIGSLYNGTSGLTGFINNFRLVKGTALYTTNFTPPTAPLTAVANTQLLTCQNNRFKDNSSNRFPLTRAGLPVAIVQAFSPFAPGVNYSPTANGGSCYFNSSTSDYLTLPSTSALQGLANMNMTIEFWINLANRWGASSYNIVQKGRTGTSDYEWGVYLIGSTGDTGTISWQPQTGGSGTSVSIYSSSSVNIYSGTWNHVAISVSGTTAYYFLNGNAAGTSSITLSSFNSTGALSVTNNNNGTNTFFQGHLSDLRITPNVAIYTSNFTPATSTLTSYSNANPSTLLLNFNNGGIVDQHSSINYVTLGNVQTSSSNVKYGSSSIRLTGTTGSYLQTAQQATSVATLAQSKWQFGSFTVEYWIYANAFSQGSNSESNVIGQLLPTTTTTYWSFGPISNGTVRWYYLAGTGQTLTTSTALSTGQWYHLAFVNNAGALAIYINGVSSATGTISGTPTVPTSAFLIIGSANNVVFNGYLDDVRISYYPRYTGNFTPPTSGFLTQ